MPQAAGALALSLGLVAFWTLLGMALAALVDGRRAPLQNLLLAPAYGIAVLVLAVLLTTRAGLPTLSFGPALGLVLLVLALIIVWRAGAAWPVKQYAPFIGIFLVALLVTGRPMLERGFGWLALANDDMANYVLGADLLARQGFASAPDYAQLAAGRDYSQYYWFALVPGGARPGSELLLGWVVSVTALSGHEAFMPLLLALHVALVSAAGALAHDSRRSVLVAAATCALIALSALTSLGTLYQLIAQVTGLGLLVASVVLLLGTVRASCWREALCCGVLSGVIVTALLVVYPELFPFLVLAFALHTSVQVVRRRLCEVRLVGLAIASSAVTSLVLLNTYVPRVLDFLRFQVASGLRPNEIQSAIFPYFLLPSGLADFWGFQAITDRVDEPWMSVSIGLGAVLLLASVASSAMLVWRGYPVAAAAFPMLGFSIRLIMLQSGFGLFKLAMYVQPFLLATIVVALLGSRTSSWRLLPLGALGAAGLIGQTAYVERSQSAYGTVPGNSPVGVVQEFRSLLGSVPDGRLAVDTPNIVLGKILAFYTRGRTANFPDREFFSNIVPESIWLRDPVFRDNIERQFNLERFSLQDPVDPTRTDSFVINALGDGQTDGRACDLLVSVPPSETIFNHLHQPPLIDGQFAATSCDKLTDHLLFIHSALGQDYYWVGSRHFDETPANTSLYALEPDILRPGGSMAGIGRYLLFEVLHPSQPVRLVVDFTATLKADARNELPQADVIGATRESLPVIGRASARVVSPPLQPQRIGDRDYVLLDMGTDGVSFREPRSGLLTLYGRDIPLDRRKLVAFARDISAISDAEYAARQPPARVDDFVHQLADPNLEYSGIYEDGWVSESAYLRLDGPTTAPAHVVVRGMVPNVGDPTFAPELRVLVDGHEVARQVLQPGEFTLLSPPLEGSGPSRVELRFSEARNLPDPDNRPIAAQLRSVAFEPGALPNVNDIVQPDAGVSLGKGWYPFETFRGEQFRWVANDAELVLTGSRGGEHVLRLDVEPGPGLQSRPFRLVVLDTHGRVVASAPVDSRQTIRLTLPVEAPDSGVFRLHVDGGGASLSNDPRTLNFRVFHVDAAS